MCNGESTRVTQGGSIAVLHPTPPSPLLRRTHSSSSSSSSVSSSSDDEIQQEEILLYFTNPLSKTSSTNVEMAGFDHQTTHAAWVVIHRDGDLSSSSSTQRSSAFCSFPIKSQNGQWELERKLELGVGERGIIGRRVSVLSGAQEVLAQGVIGWN
ncbi:hypothetical protein COCC4DRAFT_154680 [Bipolaris maydis ATCC 48331]|uniref:Uncharacterized protein n=2 Tax=Cochliobolus heterostrophus TaxID=5016 RepID=M2SHU6_COCH5|nr:uncharacterized protein COCC4DRAFT_154680 [Bipolaris maydis ATCC 48331]EMD84955.1 hypothetical protein COCHEDRAFT_1120602 [Bipolaris maydis C5]KAH7563582.1 hypothetical protein BM1_00629 [Bipolaris maydis]ENH98881.1 hypothetical protein COCC4DRAFT_154680 [Bipolaris maydis ATCC 48331]KAJ5025748.1 hypothetical protein J3E73DRAFT_413953 [Bipolaris maydis]KAJ5041402.1 hypothetical protein J3E74DRAFT_450225 [Bipolaris maydis]